MHKLFIYVILMMGLLACQNEQLNIEAPSFINFSAVTNNADESTTARKTEAFRAKVSLQGVGSNEIVVIADALEGGRSLAYVLQQDASFTGEALEFTSAWVVYLQDHLLLIDERSDRRIKLSIQNRPLDTEIVSESATFTQVIAGVGLARYPDQSVRPEQLSTVTSYLMARSQ